MTPADVQGVEIIRAQVPSEMADRLRGLAAARDRTLSAELRIAVRAHLDDAESEAA